MVDVNEEETNDFSRIMINMLDDIVRNMENSNSEGNVVITFGIEELLDELTFQNIMGASMDEEHEKTLPKKDNVELSFTGNVYEKCDNTHMCCMCLTELENGEYIDVCEGCGCINHYDCMNEWVKRKIECPTCRKQLHNKTYIKDEFTKFIETELDI